MEKGYINVIGAGLAGCEAAKQISSHGIKVHLYEMKPKKKTPAHHSDLFGELVFKFIKGYANRKRRRTFKGRNAQT